MGAGPSVHVFAARAIRVNGVPPAGFGLETYEAVRRLGYAVDKVHLNAKLAFSDSRGDCESSSVSAMCIRSPMASIP